MSDLNPLGVSSKLRNVHDKHRFQTPRIVIALMLREMATTYGKSVGGYAWAILDPILGVALLSLIFSLALHRPPLGDNFVLFYASGYLPFAMFNGLTHKIAKAVSFSKPFMAYPRVTFIDSLIARALLNSITDVLVFVIVVGGIIIAYSLPLSLDAAEVIIGLASAIFLAFGIGTINCFIMTSFPLYERVWSIVTRPLFLMSGIFFTYDAMPQSAQNILWFNPLIHVVGLVRQGLYPTYDGSYISIPYVFLVGSICLFLGLLLLKRHFRRLMES